MNTRETFQVPASQQSISDLIAEYEAKRDGGDITKEADDGTLEVIAS